VDLIHLAHDIVQRLGLVNMVTKLSKAIKYGQYLYQQNDYYLLRKGYVC
jgi:hypothetical protein